MADSKITALTAISTVDPTADPLVIVDVSDTSMAASGTTKKSTINQLLGAGGTATLASATISGDLTAARLIVTGGTIPTNGLWLPTTNTLEFAANSLAQYRIAPLGVFSWYDGAGGTRMTLNANGLGIGVTPSAWAGGIKAVEIGELGSAYAGGGNNALVLYNTYFNGGFKYAITGRAASYYQQTAGAHNWFTAPSGTANDPISFGDAKMKLDASGNLIVNGTTQFAKISSYVTNSGTFQSALGATNGANSDFVVRIKTSVSDIYNSVGNLTLSTGGGGGTERVRVKNTGQLRFIPLAADPSGAEAGDVYYNSSSNKLKCYDGSTWNDLF